MQVFEPGEPFSAAAVWRRRIATGPAAARATIIRTNVLDCSVAIGTAATVAD
jgi:hypothetical protein